MKKRTNVDWTKHELSITCYKGKPAIYDFRKGNSCVHAITFINVEGVLSVTGDWGNWIFCREFHPTEEGYVSDSYWIEKLQISSCQDPYDFEQSKVKEEVEQLKKDHDLSEEEIEFLDDLVIEAGEGKYAFIAKIMNDKPNDLDYEFLPNGKVVQWWLQVVFDAFDEICHRLKSKSLL